METGTVDGTKLKALHYAHLDEADFELLLEVYRQRQLNPWTGCLVARRIKDGRRGSVLEVITTIGVLRQLGLRTGLHEGETAAEWCGEDGAWTDVWTSSEPPHAARVGVWRKGYRQAVYGIALWRAYARTIIVEENGERVVRLEEFWEKQGPHMLAKCAAAIAYRAAYPDEIGMLYTEDEWGEGRHEGTETRRHEGEEGTEGRRHEGTEGAVAVPDDEAMPQSPMTFQLALVDLGYRTQAERDALVEQYRRKLRGLTGPAFYAAVVREIARTAASARGD
jgi:hypothetical protein